MRLFAYDLSISVSTSGLMHFLGVVLGIVLSKINFVQFLHKRTAAYAASDSRGYVDAAVPAEVVLAGGGSTKGDANKDHA